MAFTVAKVQGDFAHIALGNAYAAMYDLTFDASYASGGESITAAELGLKKLLGMLFLGGNAASGKLHYAFDTANSKILAWCPTGGASAPTSLAAPAAAAPGVGTFTVTTTPDAGATTMTGSAAKPALVGVITGALAAPALTGGQAIEMGATADLSTITIRILAFGY